MTFSFPWIKAILKHNCTHIRTPPHTHTRTPPPHTHTRTPPPHTHITGCDRNIDVVFIIDQSGSVGSTNHNLAKQFISNVVSFFSISPTQTRVGIVTYSSSSRIEFNLLRYTNLGALTTAIDNIPYRGGRTVTALALEDARDALNPSQGHGARPASEGIPRIAILITGEFSSVNKEL